MSRIEQSMEKALKLRDDDSVPVRKKESPPTPIPDLNYTDEEKDVHLRDYIEVLLRRKSIVLVFLIAVVSAVTIASFLMTPMYQAQATIEIKAGKTNIVEFQDVYRTNRDSETQHNILKSRNLAKRVATKLPAESLPITKDSGFLSSIMHSAQSFFMKPEEKNQGQKTEKAIKKISAGALMSKLEVFPIKKSDLVNINFVSEDPLFAATVANTFADEYVNFAHESKLTPTMLGGERLRQEVEEMGAKLELSERELSEYVARSEFIFTKDDKNYGNLLTQKLSKLNGALDNATSERISKKATYEEVKKSGIDYQVILKNPLMQTLTKEYIDLESEYYNLLAIHKPEYPRMVRLKSQIEKLKKRIEIEEKKTIDTLYSDYSLALNREKLLSFEIQKLRQNVNAFQKNMIHFLTLKREVETNRELYTSLLQRLKEVDVSAALTESDVQILDRAQVPRIPFKPKKVYNIILSMIFGLMGGVFLAFFAEYFDRSVKTDDDVERILRLPVLGKVPLEKENPKKLVNLMSGDNMAYSEAFRSLGARIQSANLAKQILITSPMEQEGKTVISASIAMSLISSQEKGILIDGDLRKPDVHTLFEMDNSMGLSSFLSGVAEYEGIIKKSPYLGLDVITAGPIPPNPSELLNSPRMRELIDALSAAYDYVIIDSPPVLGMSDSLILSTAVEGVIMVAKANSTPGDALTQANRALQSVNAQTLGVILNGVSYKSKYAYSSYYCSPYLKEKGGKRKLLSR